MLDQRNLNTIRGKKVGGSNQLEIMVNTKHGEKLEKGFAT